MKKCDITVENKLYAESVPLRIALKGSTNTLECAVLTHYGTKKENFDLSKITHYNGEEIFGAFISRPLSRGLELNEKPMLNISVDSIDSIISIEVVKPV